PCRASRSWPPAARWRTARTRAQSRSDGRIPPPGIGKSRVAREAAALAMDRGVEVVWSYYESHARDIPFHVVTNLLRAGIGVRDPDGAAGRARIRERVPDRCAQTTASYAKSRRRCRLPRDQVAIPR